MLKATFSKLSLKFHIPAGTSRGVLTDKKSWIISLFDTQNTEIKGVGECSLIHGLSPDPEEDYEEMLGKVCDDPGYFLTEPVSLLHAYPSIRFGLEMAWLDLSNGGTGVLFKTDFTTGQSGISINGLIWMSSIENMLAQIKARIEEGYRCIKLKIGTLHFNDELNLLKKVRAEFGSQEIQLRVDANGAFTPNEAFEKIKMLSDFDVHSIEQPIRPGQWETMAALCATSLIPVALDEELFFKDAGKNKYMLLNTIKPQYIVLKPSMLGGFATCKEWIALAETLNIHWWITSALESNIGLNALAQWTYTLNNPLYHGLGTGKLFVNNLPSDLYIENGTLKYKP